jgi:hypothetical protein
MEIMALHPRASQALEVQEALVEDLAALAALVEITERAAAVVGRAALHLARVAPAPKATPL